MQKKKKYTQILHLLQKLAQNVLQTFKCKTIKLLQDSIEENVGDWVWW